jgi:hypothetical protein
MAVRASGSAQRTPGPNNINGAIEIVSEKVGEQGLSTSIARGYTSELFKRLNKIRLNVSRRLMKGRRTVSKPTSSYENITLHHMRARQGTRYEKNRWFISSNNACTTNQGKATPLPALLTL